MHSPERHRCRRYSAISRKRVLVAEKDDIVLALISHILNRQGYSVDIASTADQALVQLQANHYDALLLDAALPGGGLDWIRSVATRSEKLVILTAGPDAVDVPARVVLQKPIEFALLVEAVASCVTPPD